MSWTANLTSRDVRTDFAKRYVFLNLPFTKTQCLDQMEGDWEGTDCIVCPECDKQLRVSPLQSLSKSNRVVFSSLNDFQNCSKLQALRKKLQHLHEKDANTKSVVFSQFTSFLVLYLMICSHCQQDLIEIALVKDNIVFERLDGTMTHQVSELAAFLNLRRRETQLFTTSRPIRKWKFF